jgi:hypothetical protein
LRNRLLEGKKKKMKEKETKKNVPGQPSKEANAFSSSRSCAGRSSVADRRSQSRLNFA